MSHRSSVGSGGPYEDKYGYSRAVRVGDHVWVAGTVARDPDVDGADAATQARSALGVIDEALREVGATLADVVRTTMYVVDPADADAVATVHGEVFRHVRPAATLVVVSQLIDPRYRVEIQVDAALH